MIWDTAGQERFHALGPIYYRDANGALLVYDITDRDSFTKVRHWVKELRKIVGKDIVLVIAGNKADLERKRQVDDNEAQEYAKSVGATHMICSAKTNKNVEEAFLELTKGMLRTQRQSLDNDARDSVSSMPSTRATIKIEKEPPKEPTCCG
jgi:Ras-related protein Rab-21